MRLEIADSPIAPHHLAAHYKSARHRLLTAKPRLRPTPPDLTGFWSMRFNAKRGIMFRWGNLSPGMNLTKICEAVCAHFGITNTDMCSARRTHNLVKPRQIVMWLARKYTGRSMPEIGRWLGGRDHTTILHGVRSIQGDFERYRSDIEAIERRLMVR